MIGWHNPGALFALALACFLGGSPVWASDTRIADRVALVVGNARYDHVASLSNPENDARLIGRALREIGFSVDLVLSADKSAMIRAIARHRKRAATAEMAVIYFAGHGLEIDGTNYLLPTDTDFSDGRFLAEDALDLSPMMDAVGGASVLRLVILDTCRNDPFQDGRADRPGVRSFLSRVRIGVGFGRIEPRKNIVVAYSARHGTVALDGAAGANSPYSAALARRLSEPELEIGMVFRKVRTDVAAATGQTQVPQIYGQFLGRDIFLHDRRPEDTPLTRQDVRFLQAALAEMGYRPGPPDGIMGLRTTQAVAAHVGSTPQLGPWAGLADVVADLRGRVTPGAAEARIAAWQRVKRSQIAVTRQETAPVEELVEQRKSFFGPSRRFVTVNDGGEAGGSTGAGGSQKSTGW